MSICPFQNLWDLYQSKNIKNEPKNLHCSQLLSKGSFISNNVIVSCQDVDLVSIVTVARYRKFATSQFLTIRD
jgi:hypothetical protein